MLTKLSKRRNFSHIQLTESRRNKTFPKFDQDYSGFEVKQKLQVIALSLLVYL